MWILGYVCITSCIVYSAETGFHSSVMCETSSWEIRICGIYLTAIAVTSPLMSRVAPSEWWDHCYQVKIYPEGNILPLIFRHRLLIPEDILCNIWQSSTVSTLMHNRQLSGIVQISFLMKKPSTVHSVKFWLLSFIGNRILYCLFKIHYFTHIHYK